MWVKSTRQYVVVVVVVVVVVDRMPFIQFDLLCFCWLVLRYCHFFFTILDNQIHHKNRPLRRSKYAITTLVMLTEIPGTNKGKNTNLVLESLLLGDVRGQVGRMNDKRGKTMARCCMIPTEGVPLCDGRMTSSHNCRHKEK